MSPPPPPTRIAHKSIVWWACAVTYHSVEDCSGMFACLPQESNLLSTRRRCLKITSALLVLFPYRRAGVNRIRPPTGVFTHGEFVYPFFYDGRGQNTAAGQAQAKQKRCLQFACRGGVFLASYCAGRRGAAPRKLYSSTMGYDRL